MINFNEEYIAKNRNEYVFRALEGEDFIKKTEEFLIDKFLGKRIFLTSSATTALELAFLAINLPRGSEVLMPSFTFPTIGNVVLRSGLVPVFCEIEKNTLTIDLKDLEQKICEKTKAIALPHYGGISANMDEVQRLCSKHNLLLIEDAATAYGAKYKKQDLGTFGDFGVFSFHGTKNASAEQGGLLLLDQKSEYLGKLEHAFEDGTNRIDFLKNEVPFYEWSEIGTNVRMINLNAAVLLASLEEQENVISKRKYLWGIYKIGMDKLAGKFPIDVMEVPENRVDNGHVFYVLFENESVREDVRRKLNNAQVEANFHYIPLHLSRMGKKFTTNNLPKTENFANRLLRFPLHMNLSEDDILNVIKICDNILSNIYE